MDNVCRECGRKFHSDLRFCPRCGGGAKPQRVRDWHYRPGKGMAHEDPVQEDEYKVHRQNAWMLLSCGILLLPVWLLTVDEVIWNVNRGEYLDNDNLYFLLTTSVLILVGAGMSSAFQAKRSGLQVVAPGLVIVHAALWSVTIMIVLLIVYFLVMLRWAAGEGRSARMDPTYLPVITGIGMLSLILMYLWLLGSPMIDSL